MRLASTSELVRKQLGKNRSVFPGPPAWQVESRVKWHDMARRFAGESDNALYLTTIIQWTHFDDATSL
jgi:hypothetical protein